MVKKFLLNYKQELLEQKIDFMKLLQKNAVAIKEIEEHILYIENSEDKNYESFSPQNYQNKSNEIKIKNLKEEQKKIMEMNEQIEIKIDSVCKKMDELETVIKEVRKQEKINVSRETL